MKETPEQYQSRILGYSANKDPLKILASTPKRIARLIQDLSKAQMRRRLEPEKWSISEIIAHLADAELAIGFRYRQVLSRNGIFLQAFDQETWAVNGNYRMIDPVNSLALFGAIRAANVRLLKTMPHSRWYSYGMHEERGRETMRTIALLEAGHDINHLRQIERIATRLKQRASRRNGND